MDDARRLLKPFLRPGLMACGMPRGMDEVNVEIALDVRVSCASEQCLVPQQIFRSMTEVNMYRLRNYMLRGIGMFLFILLSGCGGWLESKVKDLVNQAFPPIDFVTAQKAAVVQSFAELNQLQTPGVLLNVPADVLTELFAAKLKTLDSRAVKIETATLTPVAQGFRVTADISGNINNPKGTFKAKLEGWATVSLAAHVLSVRPGLKSAALTHLNLEDAGWSAEPAARAVNAVLRRYIDNVNGQLKPQTFPIDLSVAGLSDKPITIVLPDKSTRELPAVHLGPAAILVSTQGVHVLADLQTEGIAAAKPPPCSIDNAECYQRAFRAKAELVKPGLAASKPGLFVADAFVTHVLTPAFPPIDLSNLQLEATNSLMTALSTDGPVAMGINITGPRLIEILTNAATAAAAGFKGTKFGKPTVTLGEQSIEIGIPVSGAVEGAQLAYSGKVKAAGIVGATGDALYYRVALTGLQLDSLAHTAGRINAQQFVESLNRLVSQLLPHLNQAMDKQPIKIPLPALKPIPLSTVGVTFTPAALSIPAPSGVQLIPLIDSKGLRVLVVANSSLPPSFKAHSDVTLLQTLFGRSDLLRIPPVGRFFSTMLAPNATLPEKALASTVPTAESGKPPLGDIVRKRFADRWATTLPAMPDWEQGMPDFRAAVSAGWVIDALSNILEYNQLSINASFDSKPVHYDTGKIRLAGDLRPNCTVPRTCSRGSCPLGSCSRDGCAWHCGDLDLACKAGEAACNVREETKLGACSAAANTNQLACNTAEESKLGACNTLREAEVLACNVANEAVRAIQKIDGVGTANGEARATAAVRMRNPLLHFDRPTSTVSLEMDIGADTDLAGDVNFTPYDIGHVLVCPVKGKVGMKTHGTVPIARMRIATTLSDVDDGQGTRQLQFAFSPIPLKGKLMPAPIDALIQQNSQVFVTCSPVLTGLIATAAGVGAIQAFGAGDIIGAVEKAIPKNQEKDAQLLKAITNGIVDMNVDIPPMQVAIPAIEISVPGGKIVLQGRWQDGALMYSGK